MKRFLLTLTLAVPLSFWLSSCAFISSPPTLETITTVEQGPGNIAVGYDGRIFMSMHSLYRPKTKVVEVLADGSTVPFPNKEWASMKRKNGQSLRGVLGIQTDKQGRVWMLDSPRIVVWDTKNDKLDRILDLKGPARNKRSFFNDIAIDLINGKVYVADASALNPAIVVVDIETNEAYRVLERHKSTLAKPIPMIVDGNNYSPMKDGKTKGTVGADGITLDPQSQWLYFTPSQGDTLWRVKIADILNRQLSDEQLGSRVQAHGSRPNCDGITIDNAGNVYITDLGSNGVGVVKPDGSYQLLVQDDTRLNWTDSIAMGPDGYIYAVNNQLHRSAVFNKGKNLSMPPFYITRFKALAPGEAGR